MLPKHNCTNSLWKSKTNLYHFRFKFLFYTEHLGGPWTENVGSPFLFVVVFIDCRSCLCSVSAFREQPFAPAKSLISMTFERTFEAIHRSSSNILSQIDGLSPQTKSLTFSIAENISWLCFVAIEGPVSSSSSTSPGYGEAQVAKLCASWSTLLDGEHWMRELMTTGQVPWHTWPSVLTLLALFGLHTSSAPLLSEYAWTLRASPSHTSQLSSVYPRLATKTSSTIGFSSVKLLSVRESPRTHFLISWIDRSSGGNIICLVFNKP